MRYLRCFLTVLLIIAVLMLLLVTGLVLYATPERTGMRINAFLESTAGIRLSDPIPSELKRLPKLVAVLPAGTITKVKSGEAIGRYDRLVFTFNPFAIFAAAPRIARIEADGAVLAFEASDLLRALPAQQKQTESVSNEMQTQETDTTIGSLSTCDQPDAAKQDSIAFWTIDEIELRNADLHLTDFNTPVALTGTRLILKNFSEHGASLQLNTVLSSEHISGELVAVTAFDQFAKEAPQAKALQAHFTGIAFDQEVDADISTEALLFKENRIESNGLNFSAKTSRGLLLQASSPVVEWSTAGFAGSIRASASVNRTHEQLVLSMSGNVEQSFEDGNAAVTELCFDSRRIPLNAPEPNSKLPFADRLTGEIRYSGINQKGAIQLRGAFFGAPLSFDGLFSTKPEALGISDAPLHPFISGTLRTGAFKRDVLELLFAEPAWLDLFDFQGNLIFSGLSSAASTTSFQADMSVRDGKLVLTGENTSCFSGRTDFTLETNRDGRWTGKIAMTDVNSLDVLRTFGLSSVLSGVMSGEFEASGCLNKKNDEVLSGTAVLRNGALAGLDIIKAANILDADRPDKVPPEVIRADASTSFETIQLHLCQACDNNTVPIKGDAAGQEWHAIFSGDLHRVTVQFDILAKEDRPAIPINVELTLNSNGYFTWMPDWQTALEHIESTAPSVFSLKNAFQSLKRTLRDFWQGLEMPSLPDWHWDFSLPSFELPDFLQGWHLPWRENSTPIQPAI